MTLACSAMQLYNNIKKYFNLCFAVNVNQKYFSECLVLLALRWWFEISKEKECCGGQSKFCEQPSMKKR
jgi:hypothetical protein